MEGGTVLNVGYMGHAHWAHTYTRGSQPCTDLSNAIARPTTPSWSGKGLPPVGVVCEVYHDGDWYETKIIGIDTDDGSCVFKTHGDYDTPYDGFVSASSFRPIRTPEQIAADEREAAVSAMLAECHAGSSRDTFLMQQLYDAGYRKP